MGARNAINDISTQPSAAIHCRCCGSTEIFLCGTKTGQFINDDFHFYRCSRCTFQFVEPVTAFDIYDDAYYTGRGPDRSVDYEREYVDYPVTPRVFEFEDFLRIARRHFDHSPRRDVRTWLDYGCGAGGFLRYLSESGHRVFGSNIPLELFGHDVASYASRLKERNGFRMLDLGELHNMSNAFDVISCVEVLEHLAAPVPVIQLFGRLLKPGGLLILTTGNMASPVARLRGVDFSYCVPEIHVSLFNPQLLASLYRMAGLKSLRLRFRGAITFRILKRLKLHPLTRQLSALAHYGPVIRFVDFLYGTSAIPCATKPLDRT